MSLQKPIARTLDEPARILGLTPLELASCAVFYAVVSSMLKGVPFGALLSLVIAGGVAATLVILNRTYPPHHGPLFLLSLVRPGVAPVMPIGESS